MRTIKGQLCYSPFPPAVYGLHGMGHGQMYGHDTQLWNLMYLSLPAIDNYLAPGSDAEAVYNSIPIGATAACIALLRGEHMMRQYPRMRYWLTLPPDVFCDHVSGLSLRDYNALPTAMNIDYWGVQIIIRSKLIRHNDPASKSLDTMLAKIRKEIGV